MTEAIVRASALNLRRSLTTGKVVKALRRNSRVEILGQQSWYRVRTRDGLEGFVLGDFLDTVIDEGTGEDEVAFSGECVLRTYHNERFIGKELRADVEFFPLLDRVAGFAEDCDLHVWVTSSARDPDKNVDGAIVKPAQRSNHLVGHAIDMNLKTASDFFNSTRLRKKNLPSLPAKVRRFIQKVRDDDDLRWGGDFGKEDPVHVDDGINVHEPDLWDAKLASRE